jgi:hypothetical protein
MVRLLLVACVVVCVACAAKDEVAQQEKGAARNWITVPVAPSAPPVDTITQPPPLPCFSPDSGPLQFGEITVSAVDQDASGVSYTFEVTPKGMIGAVVDARGEAPPPKRLQGLHYRAATDSLVFWYASGSGDRYIFSFRPTCDSLFGRARLFVTDTDAGQLEHEVVRRQR